MTNPPVMEGADMEVNDLHISKKAKTSHDYAQEKLVFPLEFAAEGMFIIILRAFIVGFFC